MIGAAAFVIVRRDLRILLRRKSFLALLVLYPLLTVGILGIGFDARGLVRIAWVNQDLDITSFEIAGEDVTMQTLRDELGRVASLRDAGSEADAADLLRRGEVDAGVVIPPHFLIDVKSLVRNTNVTLLLDPSDPVRSQVAESLLRGVTQAFVERFIRFKMEVVLNNLELALEGNLSLPVIGDVRGFRVLLADLIALRDGANLTPELRNAVDADIRFLGLAVGVLEDSSTYLRATALPVEVRERGISKQGLGPRDVLAPLTIALSIVWTGSLAGASLVGMERRRGLLERLVQSPASLHAVLGGKLLACLVLVTAQSALLFGIAVGVFGVAADSLPLAFGVILAATIGMAGLGMLIASFSRGLEDAVLATVFVVFPLFLLSGILFPASYMPEPLAGIAGLLPPTVAVEALRGAMLRSAGAELLLPPMGYLLASGTAAFLLGTWLLRRRP